MSPDRTPVELTRADRDWLAEVLPGERIVEATALSGGFRNDNVKLVTAGGDAYVLRVYRDADAGTGAIEAALARRVADVVPVPTVFAVDGRRMLAEFVPGRMASRVCDVDPFGLGHALGETLARIGTIRFDRTGFFDGPDLVPDGTDVSEGLASFVRDRVAGVLSEQELSVLLRHADDVQPRLASIGQTKRLVHSDFNPKNLLVRRHDGVWIVTAVLDWEFAFSGPPLADLGNMLRFSRHDSPALADGVVAGFGQAGGDLPPDWPILADALDLFALADLVTRGPDHPLFEPVRTLLRRRIDMLGRTD